MPNLSISPLLNTCGKTLITYNSKISAYDSTTRVNSFTITTYDINVLKGSYNSKEVANSGGLVQINDIKVIVNPDDITFTPSLEDTIIINSITYEIIRIKKIDIGTTNIAYIFQIRC